MTLLLNTELVPLYDKDGAPIPPGFIIDSAQVETPPEDSPLVEVKQADIPADAENVIGNAEDASGDDSPKAKAAKKGSA